MTKKVQTIESSVAEDLGRETNYDTMALNVRDTLLEFTSFRGNPYDSWTKVIINPRKYRKDGSEVSK